MFRVRSLAMFCLTLGLFLTMDAPQAHARGWCFSGARYSSSYFHDYYNYGARYSHRSYGSYYGNYGVSPHSGYAPGGHYGGWSTYAPYAYTPTVYAGSTQYVSYGSRHASGCNTCAPVVIQPVVTAPCAPVCAPTCCSPRVSCFSDGCGSRRRGLLGPLCPLRRSHSGCGTCGSFGYSSCGW